MAASALLLALGPLGGESARANTHASPSVPTPFEVTESPAGNYLAALIAGAERDTNAASTFFRESLRADPNNIELIERAFVATLANGDIQDSFALADRLIAHDPNNGLAHLTLGVRDIKAKRFASARAHFAKGGVARQRDVTATLLSAWAFAGAGDVKSAVALVDKLQNTGFTVFRDFHAGLILEASGKTVEAGQRFQAAYAADPNTLRLADAYARNLDIQGKVDEARAAYKAYEQLAPRQPIVQAALADLAAGKKLEPLARNADEGAAEALGMASARREGAKATNSPRWSICASPFIWRRATIWRRSRLARSTSA